MFYPHVDFAGVFFFGQKTNHGLDAKMQRCLPKALPDPWHGAQCARSHCRCCAGGLVQVTTATRITRHGNMEETEKNRW